MIDMWDSIARTLVALAAVLLLMGAAAWVARRVLAQRSGAPGGAPLIQVMASSYVAPRKSIALVSVAGEYFAVGLTADDLVPLGRIEDQTRVAALLSGSSQTQNPPIQSPSAILPTDWWAQITTHLCPGEKGGPNA